MKKKEYNGLAADIISFGMGDIETGLVAESGCKLGSVQYYTEDDDGHSLPIGVCWDRTNKEYSLEWDTWTGDYVP